MTGAVPNHGLLVRADTELNDQYNFASSDTATAGQRPKLVVVYSLPSDTPPVGGGASNYSYAAQSASCPAGALSKAHAVTSVSSDIYCYDANGNMTLRAEGGITYTWTLSIL